MRFVGIGISLTLYLVAFSEVAEQSTIQAWLATCGISMASDVVILEMIGVCVFGVLVTIIVSG